MTTQSERTLQQEIILRLKSWPVITIAIPNSIYFPARTDEERSMIARVIHRMKSSGQITPGAPDLVVVWNGGAGLLEIKRPAVRDLLGQRAVAGRPGAAQLEIAELAKRLYVNHAFCTSWDEVQSHLLRWGAPRPTHLGAVS